MRKRRRRTPQTGRLGVIFVILLMLPVAAGIARISKASLSGFARQSAMIAAALNMPEGSIEILRERFAAEELPPESPKDTQDDPHQPQWPNIPDDFYEDGLEQPQQDATQPSTQPFIPTQHRGTLVGEDFSGRTNTALIPFGDALIKNETRYDEDDIAEILEKDFNLNFSDTADPQVLIVHTHATESFERYDSTTYDTRNTWRSTDNNNNMVTVGNEFVRVLEANGIGVIHDTTQHDYPSYNGSYERSAKTISEYLDEYPIKVVLDLHRDAMNRDESSIVKPVSMIDGKKAAQIMIISACDDGTMDVPEWRQNLRFAAAFNDAMERDHPGLTRPVYFCYRKYNMDLTTGSLLLEFGSNANTLEEASYAARLSAQSLADLLNANTGAGDIQWPGVESDY